MAKQKKHFVVDLFEQQSTPLVKYLTARFREPEEAREVAQEAWLRIYRLENPEELRNPKAFLFQTASNLAIDRKRRAVLENLHYERERGQQTEFAPSAEDSITAQESLSLIEKSLSELPQKCRDAFLLHRGKDLSYPEIARELGVSVSMIEKYIIKALKHFRNTLQ